MITDDDRRVFALVSTANQEVSRIVLAAHYAGRLDPDAVRAMARQLAGAAQVLNQYAEYLDGQTPAQPVAATATPLELETS